MKKVFNALLIVVMVIVSCSVLAEENSLLAETPDPSLAEPSTIHSTDNGDAAVYVDLSVGYAAVNWSGFGVGAFNGYTRNIGVVDHLQHGGMTAGFDVGYQINPYLAIEGGWYYLPPVRGRSDINASLPPLAVRSWMGYLGVKGVLPLSQQFHVFAKVAGAYRSLTYRRDAADVPGFGVNNNRYMTVAFGGGVEYAIDDNWSISAQYLGSLKKTGGDEVTKRSPAAHLFLASVGYRFGLY